MADYKLELSRVEAIAVYLALHSVPKKTFGKNGLLVEAKSNLLDELHKQLDGIRNSEVAETSIEDRTCLQPYSSYRDAAETAEIEHQMSLSESVNIFDTCNGSY